MSIIKLPCFGIQLNIEGPPNNLRGTIIYDNDLYEMCPCCNQPLCNFSCDESQMENSPENEEDVCGRLQYNGAIEGITSMILSHACAGIEITSQDYVDGVKTAIDAAGQNL